MAITAEKIEKLKLLQKLVGELENDVYEIHEQSGVNLTGFRQDFECIDLDDLEVQ